MSVTKKRIQKNLESSGLSPQFSADWYLDSEKVFSNWHFHKNNLMKIEQAFNHKNSKEQIVKIIKKNPEILKSFLILLGTRWKSNELYNSWQNKLQKNLNYKDIYTFFEKTKIFALFKKCNVQRLSDYVLGVEVGLNTNAKKNRTGKWFEKKISNILIKNQIMYEQNIQIKDVVKKYASLFPAEIIAKWQKFSKNTVLKGKIFDFSFILKNCNSKKEKEKLCLIECNFYNSHGSKIQEIYRSYKNIESTIKKHKIPLNFLWVTGGIPLKSSKRTTYKYESNSKIMTSLKEFECLIQAQKTTKNEN